MAAGFYSYTARRAYTRVVQFNFSAHVKYIMKRLNQHEMYTYNTILVFL